MSRDGSMILSDVRGPTLDVVVDLDLEKFFDRVNHNSLMARLSARSA
jgi:retron-type reverse transcriptase